LRKVKNANDKLVCCIDEKMKKIEIVHKGYKTILQFNATGNIIIKNFVPEKKTL